MSAERLVTLGPPPRLTARDAFRIALSMTVTCAVGALILGAVYLGTNRYQEAARVRSEQAAVSEMLGLDATATVVQIHQYLDPVKKEVVYRTKASQGSLAQELVFTLDGVLVRRGQVAIGSDDTKGLRPLGRIFVARRGDVPAGFVAEGETSGYKNRIRFFVAIDAQFELAGVRVIEHEEDPGLGAEIATPWFQRQFVGRSLASLTNLDLVRDPMPEDWSTALRERSAGSTAWRTRYLALLTREQAKPIYAVTGATISSRALTNGVRASAQHFERRWALLAPYIEGRP